MMARELYVLRHGETVWNAEGRMQGALDSPLTPRGRAQAQRQALILQGLDLDDFDVFSSPQGRAVETARIALAPHVTDLRTDDRLREIGVGVWAGRLRRELDSCSGSDAASVSALSIYENAPGGEGFERLSARCEAFLGDLRRPAVIVTHGITSRMLRAIAMGGGIGDLAEMPCGQGVVYHIKGTVQKRLD